LNFGKKPIQISKVLPRKSLESESVVDRGNSSPHAAAAAVGSFRPVLLLNSLKEQQLKKRPNNHSEDILLCATFQQTEARPIRLIGRLRC
jgi:hypothetical protein